jgi:hypothetical protein
MSNRTTRHLVLAVTAAAASCAAVLLLPRDALAQRYYVYEERAPRYSLDLGLDLEGAAILDAPRPLSGNTLSGGSGFKLRVGERIRFRGGFVTPEVGYGYMHLFAEDDQGDAFAWNMQRVFAGARIGFGRFITPIFYAHAGYGWRNTQDPYVNATGGLALDAGAALDFHLGPFFSVGLHAEYVTISSTPYAPDWLGLGGHADVNF